MWNPDTVAKLQQAVRITGYPTFKEYAKLVNDETKPIAARSAVLLRFKQIRRRPCRSKKSNPAKEIVKRFVTGAMSLGSISRESHEMLAIAMNRNRWESPTPVKAVRCDPVSFQARSSDAGWQSMQQRLPSWFARSAVGAIKQVASARFGVTTEYLVNAEELQIKMAQGAKPGEGGQLPGHKVDEYIGSIRHSTPGVGLISRLRRTMTSIRSKIWPS